LDPMKLLGPSAFGPLKFRPVSDDGAEGDWQPLASLVRMPDLKEVRCTPVAVKGYGKSATEINAAREDKSEHPSSSENRLVAGKSPEITADEKTTETQKPAASDTKPNDGKAQQECTLTGDKLFLIDAVSADPDFANSITVPDGFVEARLTIPTPKDKTLYIK